MIRTIGIIYQDAYSLGFLEGLKKRLACDAEVIPPPGSVGKSRNMTRRQARQAWMYFQQKGVDLVVRFTDADGAGWQQVKRDEYEIFPQSARAVIVCGVAVNNTEEWLAIVPEFLAERLSLDVAAVRTSHDPSSLIKGAIDRSRKPMETVYQFVERLVTEVPENVFKRWLSKASFRSFYEDCRRIAQQFGCQTKNEL